MVALVMAGAIFFTGLCFKDRWIWRWAVARVHDVWPGVRLAGRVASFNFFGIGLEGVEAEGQDRAHRSIVLKGGSLFADAREGGVFVRRFEFADAAIDRLRAFAAYNVKIREARVGVFVERLSKGKVEAKDVTVRGRVIHERFYLDALACSIFEGILKARGEGARGPKGIASFNISFDLSGVDVKKALRALASEAKFELTGAFSGSASLVFEEGRLKAVQGLFTSLGGGRMVVTDASVFQGVNATPGANLVVENLKDYHYDIGDITLGLEGPHVKADIDLKGVTGRRRLTIVFHGEDNG
jgi:hypothetical protein